MTQTLTAPEPATGGRVIRRSAIGSRPRPRRRWRPSPLLLGGVALTVLVAVHLALAAFMRVPIIQPDELGYLQNARFLAHGGPRSETEYYPGFSLLLVPLWLVSTSPTLVFREALVVEALLGALGAVLLWRLSAVLVPALTGWRRVLAVAVALTYPSSLLYGNFALSEVAFAVVFTAVVLIAAKAFSDPRPRWYAALGASAGGLALVHPRGFAVVVAVGVFGLLVLGVRRRTLPSLGALAGGIAVSLAITRWLVTTTKGKVAPNFGAYRPDSVISKSLSSHGMLSLVSELGGQLWYLTLATFGLVPLALLVGGRALAKVLRGDRSLSALTEGFATLSFLGVWALSSMFMNLGDRADKLIYGRYNEGVILPLLVIAVAHLLEARPDRHFSRRTNPGAGRRWLGMTVVCAAVSGAFLQFGHTAAALRGALNPANVLSLSSLLSRMSDHIHVFSMTGIIVGAVIVLAVLAWRFPALAMLCLIGVFLWSVLDVETGYLIPGTRARNNQNDIARAINLLRKLPAADVTCVAWDEDKTVDFNYYNDRFRVAGQDFLQFDSTKPTPPCGTLIVSTRPDFASHFPGARAVTSEDFVNQTLWAVPRAGDPTFSVLEADGFLSPPTTTLGAAAPLPVADLQGSSITTTPGGTLTIAQGATMRMTAVVAHTEGGAPWPTVTSLHANSGEYAVELAVDWTTEATTPTIPTGLCAPNPGPATTVACPIFPLPDTLLPLQQGRVPVSLTAVDATGKPLPVGDYTLHLGLFQQGVGAFTDAGLNVPVTVVAPPAKH